MKLYVSVGEGIHLVISWGVGLCFAPTLVPALEPALARFYEEKPRQDPFRTFVSGGWNVSGVTMVKLALPPPEPSTPELLVLGLPQEAFHLV